MPMGFGISWSETPMRTRNSRPSQTRRCRRCELLGKTRSVVKKRQRPQKLAPSTIRSYVRRTPGSLLFGCSTSQHPTLFTQRPRETVCKLLHTGQPPHHKPRHRRVDEGLSGCAQPLVVLGHPPVVADPREGALHHPPPRQHPEAPRRHQSLPVHLLAFLGPLLGPALGHLLGQRLSWLAHDLYAQPHRLLGPSLAPPLVSGIDPQVRKAPLGGQRRAPRTAVVEGSEEVAVREPIELWLPRFGGVAEPRDEQDVGSLPSALGKDLGAVGIDWFAHLQPPGSHQKA